MKTYQEILDTVSELRRKQFASDPEREEIMRVATTLAVVQLLEKLALSEPIPAYENVACSHCGKSFGPGDHGFSHCDSHAGLVASSQ